MVSYHSFLLIRSRDSFYKQSVVQTTDKGVKKTKKPKLGFIEADSHRLK